MSLARRAFLQALPGAAVAAPIAAKAAADGLIGQATGVAAVGQFSPGATGIGCQPAPLQGVDTIRNFFRKFGLPDFERDRIWNETTVDYLDPDIAAKRSWSMSVKIATQRQRNFDRRIARNIREWDFSDARESFLKKHGFWFWW